VLLRDGKQGNYHAFRKQLLFLMELRIIGLLQAPAEKSAALLRLFNGRDYAEQRIDRIQHAKADRRYGGANYVRTVPAGIGMAGNRHLFYS
jgi:hypothetical protein